jgi:cyclin-dependent kinase-like
VTLDPTDTQVPATMPSKKKNGQHKEKGSKDKGDRGESKDKPEKEKNSMNKYQVLSVVGEGAYGVVMKCTNKKTGQVVAMKKFKESGEKDDVVRKTILREVKVLKMMRHVEPVVHLIESFRRKGRLYLVFEFVQRNLLEVIEENPDGLVAPLIHSYIYQLCAAIAECHKMRVRVRVHARKCVRVRARAHVRVCVRVCVFALVRACVRA